MTDTPENRVTTATRLDDSVRAELLGYATLKGTDLSGLLREVVLPEWLVRKMPQFEHPAVLAELERVATIDGLTAKQRIAVHESVQRSVAELPIDQDPATIEW